MSIIYPVSEGAVVDRLGTTSILANALAETQPQFYRTIFRGKNLGRVTAENIDDFVEKHGIDTGKFNDLWIGDYFTMPFSGVTAVTKNIQNTYEKSGTTVNVEDRTVIGYQGFTADKVIRIAGISTYLGTGDEENDAETAEKWSRLDRPHIVCVPDEPLIIGYMNRAATAETASADGGYLNSDLFRYMLNGRSEGTLDMTINDPQAGTIHVHDPGYQGINASLRDIFGDHLIRHRDLLSSAIRANTPNQSFGFWSGASSEFSWAWVEATLLSEIEINGCLTLGSSAIDIGLANRQLPLFAAAPEYMIAKPMTIELTPELAAIVGRSSQTKSWYWTKCVGSHLRFTGVNGNGTSDFNYTNWGNGIRPRFLLG